MKMIDNHLEWIALYLIFQFGLGTFFRLMGSLYGKDDDAYIGRKTYILMLIPLFGVLYSVFCLLRLALKNK